MYERDTRAHWKKYLEPWCKSCWNFCCLTPWRLFFSWWFVFKYLSQLSKQKLGNWWRRWLDSALSSFNYDPPFQIHAYNQLESSCFSPSFRDLAWRIFFWWRFPSKFLVFRPSWRGRNDNWNKQGAPSSLSSEQRMVLHPLWPWKRNPLSVGSFSLSKNGVNWKWSSTYDYCPSWGLLCSTFSLSFNFPAFHDLLLQISWSQPIKWATKGEIRLDLFWLASTFSDEGPFLLLLLLLLLRYLNIKLLAQSPSRGEFYLQFLCQGLPFRGYDLVWTQNTDKWCISFPSLNVAGFDVLPFHRANQKLSFEVNWFLSKMRGY